MCLNCGPSLQLVDTTVEIANKVGAAEIVSRVVEDLKDESEAYRKMVMDAIEKVFLACCYHGNTPCEMSSSPT